MPNYPVLSLLLGTLTVFGAACGNFTSSNRVANRVSESPPETVTPVATPSPVPVASPQASAPPGSLEYQQALDKAYSAASIAQSAQSQADWQLVESRWQNAIAILQAIPQESPQYSVAQTKVNEYQRNLSYAQQQALSASRQRQAVGVITPVPIESPALSTPIPEAPTLAAVPVETNVFRVPIKRRSGGTPIIEVTFNNQQTFEMIVDTGASGILITQPMATALGIVPVGIAKADTASASGVEFPVGIVESIAVDGVVVKNVPVAIAGSQLDVGLLGHEFFGNYDLVIRQNAIEFQVR